MLGRKRLVSASLHERVIETWREVADFLGMSMNEVLEMGLAKMFADLLSEIGVDR